MTLQAVAAVGQHLLMRVWSEALAAQGLRAGQVLLAPLDFIHRSQYLHARQTLGRLLELGVVPVVNENDAVADEEIRFGDNDRLAALVAHLVGADLLVLLTDTAGLFTGDPRRAAEASLIEEVVEIDHELERIAGGPGIVGGQRGHGVQAGRGQDRRVVGGRGGHRRRRPARGAGRRAGRVVPGVGTRFRPRERRLPARKLWIAFAIGAGGHHLVDAGARRALVERGRSLLPAGVVSVHGRLRRRRRGGDRRARRRGLRQGPGAPARPTWWPGGPAGGRTTCPRTSPPRSSTATTWSCWAEPGRAAGPGPVAGRSGRRPVR